MERAIFVFLSIVILIGLYFVLVFSHFDRKQFRIERLILAHQKGLEAWVRACEEFEPNCTLVFSVIKKPRERMLYVSKLARTVCCTSDEMLGLQRELADFFLFYNQMVRSFNKALSRPLMGKSASLLRFRPYAALEFVENKE